MGFKHSSIIKYLQEAIMCFLMSWKLLAGESLLFEFGSIVGIDLHRLARGTQSAGRKSIITRCTVLTFTWKPVHRLQSLVWSNPASNPRSVTCRRNLWWMMAGVLFQPLSLSVKGEKTSQLHRCWPESQHYTCGSWFCLISTHFIFVTF